MKLGNRDLHYALWCAEKHTGNSLYTEAMADLDEGVLEIEGYERKDHLRDVTKMADEWTKFDPDNPETFPPELTRVQVFDKESGDVLTAKYDYDSHEWSLSWCMITHWRPLPPPPGKEEHNEAE